MTTQAPGGPGIPAASDARGYVYVLPNTWEDHCKIGFSRDPVSRMHDLHRRWFEFFDLDRVMLVEAETVRDARDLELELRRPLSEHRAPAPLTVRREAAGHTEWFRGALAQLELAVLMLERRGHVVHAPARDWLRASLQARADRLYAWSLARLSPEELAGLVAATPAQSLVRDTFDAYAALRIDIEPSLPPEVWQWYRGQAARRQD